MIKANKLKRLTFSIIHPIKNKILKGANNIPQEVTFGDSFRQEDKKTVPNHILFNLLRKTPLLFIVRFFIRAFYA